MNWFKELIIWFFKHLFFLFPVNNKKVFFSNFNGKSFGDNPKYIFNELYKLHPDWKLIWWINDKNSPSPSHVKRVKNRISAIFHLSTSKVIVTNVKNLLPFIKKRKQFYLQTWHSALTYKPVEKDAEEYLNKEYVIESQKESKLTDAVIADNSLQVNKFNRCFYYNENTKILEFGTPKNDIYHNYTENDVLEFKKAIGVNPNCKLVVYAPTFRDNGDTSIYNLDFKAIVNAFNSNDKQDWVLLIRLHPNVVFNIDIKDNNIVNVSKFPDPQQIWIASDVIISDYSGVPFDFIEMNKPVFFYFPDYSEKIRLYKEFFDLGFDVARSEKELLDNIEHFNLNNYLKIVHEFNDKIKHYNNGSASLSTAKYIEEICLNKNWRSKNVRY